MKYFIFKFCTVVFGLTLFTKSSIASICKSPLVSNDSKIICSDKAFKIANNTKISYTVTQFPFSILNYAFLGLQKTEDSELFTYKKVLISRSGGQLGFLHYLALRTYRPYNIKKFWVYYSNNGDFLGAFIE